MRKPRHPAIEPARFALLPVLTAILGALMAGFSPVNAAGFLVEAPPPSISAGDTLVIHLVALNPAAVAATAEFPKSVEAVLTVGATSTDLEFKPTSGNSSGAVTVAPGGFAKVAYGATVPAQSSGTGRLGLAIANSPTFAVEITTTSGTADSASKPTSKRFSLKKAMDPETPETSFFKRHVFPYEPMYFLAGPEAPSVKFQVSLKYRIVNTELGEDGEAEGWLYRHAKWTEGLHFAYTQRSLWDIQAESAPFLDSSYMPELLYERPNLIDPDHGWLERIGAQVGFQHESNGKDGLNSRSLNIGYLRLPVVFGDEENFYVTLEPRAWFYVGNLTDNPDLTDYRGYIDLRLKAGWAHGLQVAGWLRAGRDFERGSAQVDLTYPLHNLFSRSLSLYLQAQYFNGYGESLINYNQRDEIWRIGFGLFR